MKNLQIDHWDKYRFNIITEFKTGCYDTILFKENGKTFVSGNDLNKIYAKFNDEFGGLTIVTWIIEDKPKIYFDTDI